MCRFALALFSHSLQTRTRAFGTLWRKLVDRAPTMTKTRREQSGRLPKKYYSNERKILRARHLQRGTAYAVSIYAAGRRYRMRNGILAILDLIARHHDDALHLQHCRPL